MTGFRKLLAGVALAAGLAAAAQAQAQTFDLTFSDLDGSLIFGTGSVTFNDSVLKPNTTVFSTPSPSSIEAFSATFTNVDGLSSLSFDLSDLGFLYLTTNGSGAITNLGFWSYNFFDGPGDICSACTTPWISNVSPMIELVDNPVNKESIDLTISATPVVAPAPEPATWAMLILGLALVGLAARARREGVTVAA